MLLIILFVFIKTLIIYLKSSGPGNCLGFAPSSQNRALCALHKPARSVRYPDSLRSIRTQIRFWCQKLHKNATPLAFTLSLNSTKAALTRAVHSNRRLPEVVSLADFRTGGVPGSEKPTPASPKGDRRSVLSEKEIQDSDNCSCLRMGCHYCFHS